MLEVGTQQVIKWLIFRLIENKKKTGVWHILNKDSREWLGTIAWHGPWRQYVCNFNENAIFNDSCLQDIKDWVSNLNRTHKEIIIRDKQKG